MIPADDWEDLEFLDEEFTSEPKKRKSFVISWV